jgi:peptidyl-prolyl cis-trans isomerase C
MTRIKLLLTTTAVAVLVACSQGNAGKGADADAVATVDGRAISRNTFEQYALGVSGKPAEDLPEEERKDLLDALVQAEVIAAQAERDGIADLDETRAAMDLSRLQILQRASRQAYLKNRQPSEEELHAEYDIQVSMLGTTEYRASQILVNTEDAAKKIIDKLKAGANFAQLAKTESVDAGTRDKGGDLDWFRTTDGPLVDVVHSLKKGEFTQEPVKTQYGYHVIRVTDTRPLTPPSYADVKDRLVQLVEQKKFKAYADGLQAKAKIDTQP